MRNYRLEICAVLFLYVWTGGMRGCVQPYSQAHIDLGVDQLEFNVGSLDNRRWLDPVVICTITKADGTVIKDVVEGQCGYVGKRGGE